MSPAFLPSTQCLSIEMALAKTVEPKVISFREIFALSETMSLYRPRQAYILRLWRVTVQCYYERVWIKKNITYQLSKLGKEFRN
jgi:hypothetical protein